MPLDHLQTLSGHKERVWTLSWNPSGTVLASSGADKTIRLWTKGRNDEWLCSSILTETHDKSIRRLSWSPCGNYLASASFDSTVCIWKKNPKDNTWSTAVNLEGHESEVKSVAWSHDGKFLASCGRDRTIWIWERSQDRDESDSEEDGAENWDCSDVKNDHSKDVKHLAWHPNHNILVSCSYDDTVKLFNLEDNDWKCYETLTSHTSTVWSICFSETGEFLATCGDDKTVRIWKNTAHSKLPQPEAHSWKCVSVIQGFHTRTIYDLSWSKEAGVIVSGSGDNSLAFYSKSNESAEPDLFTCIDKFAQAHDCDINCVSWNPKVQGLLASGGDDCAIKLWTHSLDSQGRQPLTVVGEVFKKLAERLETIDIDYGTTNCETPNLNLKIVAFQQLQEMIQDLQVLQHDLNSDEEKCSLEKLFDLKITDTNMPPVAISDLIFDADNSVKMFMVNINDCSGQPIHRVQIQIDTSKFKLTIPRRSGKLLVAANELFLIEKTGDMFKVLDSGDSQFLLGHLFILSDVKFMTRHSGRNIGHILSVDRDEKIRVSNYPEAYKIERFCFGHEQLVRRIVLVDEWRFLSIDQDDRVCLWDLSRLPSLAEDEAFRPERVEVLGMKATKRCCVR